MSKLIPFFILIATLVFACAPKAESPTPTTTVVKPVVERIDLPDVVFLNAIIDSTYDAPTCLLEIEYKNDTLKYSFNKEEVRFDEIPNKHQAWKQTIPEIQHSKLTLNLKADKATPTVDIHDTKLLLRQINQLRLSYESKANEKLLIRLPIYIAESKFKSPRTPKTKISTSLNSLPPPPPPGIYEQLSFTGPNKACVFNGKEFIYMGKQYESCKACVVTAQRPYFSISLKKNQITLNGKALAINDLEKELMDIFNTLYDEIYPNSPNIFNKLLIQFTYDMESNYGGTLLITSQLRNCFTLLRNREAQKRFDQDYLELDLQGQRTVRSIIPLVIAEDIK